MLDCNTALRLDDDGRPIPGSWIYPPLSVFSLILLNGKRPVESGWQRYCREKSGLNPENRNGHNLGVACGPASGVLVLDIDDRDAFATACEKNGWTVPDTYTVETGGGGLHYYFRYPQGRGRYGNKACKGDGFDVRGDGGQVVAPGSIHPDTGREYRLVKRVPPAPAPAWLLALYEEKPKPERKPRNFNGDEIDRLPIKAETKSLIRNGAARGNRSEPIMTVINALVFSNLSDVDIFSIFDRYPIGAKYLEKGDSRDRWLQQQIDKARSFVTDRAGDRGRQAGRQDTERRQPVESPLKMLRDFRMSKAYTDMLGNEEWFFPNLIIKGQITVIVAKSGGGKTTIFFEYIVPKMIAEHDVEVFFLDCDSPASDHEKMRIKAEAIGEKFVLINPISFGKDANFLLDLLKDMAAAGERLDNKVFILDTLKKFIDVLEKKSAKPFFELLRKLTGLGATFALLGHANKYRNKDGHLVFEGVGDIQNDADALIIFERMGAIGGIDITTVVDPDKGAKVRGLYEPMSFHITAGRQVTQYRDLIPVPDYSAGANKDQLTDEEIADEIREYLRGKTGHVNQKELIDAMMGKHGIKYHPLRAVLNAVSVHENDAKMPGQIFYSQGRFNKKRYSVVEG